jgi:hypothetical protein
MWLSRTHRKAASIGLLSLHPTTAKDNAGTTEGFMGNRRAARNLMKRRRGAEHPQQQTALKMLETLSVLRENVLP